MIRAALSLLLAAICAACFWLVTTSESPLEFGLSFIALSGFVIAAGWLAARRMM